MDYGKAFSYMFQDKNWVTKILIGGIILAVPILQFAAFGYFLEVLKNVKEGKDTPLPEWDDLGDKFVQGFKLFIAFLVYWLPFAIIFFIIIAITFVFGAVGSSGSEGAQSAASGLILLISCIGYLFVFIYSIAFLILLPEIIISFQETGNISSAFELGKIWSLTRKNIGPVLIILLLMYVANTIAGFGIILFIIGVLFTSFWAQLVSYNLYGQLAAKQAT